MVVAVDRKANLPDGHMLAACDWVCKNKSLHFEFSHVTQMESDENRITMQWTKLVQIAKILALYTKLQVPTYGAFTSDEVGQAGISHLPSQY